MKQKINKNTSTVFSDYSITALAVIEKVRRATNGSRTWFQVNYISIKVCWRHKLTTYLRTKIETNKRQTGTF